MAPLIVIDPSSFSILSEARDEDHALHLLTRLLSWLRRPGTEIPIVLVDKRSVAIMREKGMIPLFPHIQSALRRFNLDFVVSAADLAGYIEKFLSNAREFDESAIIKEAILETVSIAPDEFSAISNAEMRSISLECASLAGLNAASGLSIVYGFPLMESEKELLRITAAILLTDPNDAWPPEKQRLLDTSLVTIQDWQNLHIHLDALDIWHNAEDAEDLTLALRITVAQNGGNLQQIKFLVGPQFFASLRANGAAADGPFSSAVLTKCRQILLKTDNVSASEFRVNENPNSGARRRSSDQARAMRVHINKDHQALRLMYWELDDGTIEFANVGPKNELCIFE